MFEPRQSPRVFGLPPGADFATAFVDGLLQRNAGQPPEALARVEVFVNTRRMQRRIKTLFDAGPARLLPRIRLVTDLAMDSRFDDLPPPCSGLRRRLELTRLIGALLDQQPDLAPRAALFDLADSLAGLMDEMQGEAVTPDTIRNLDVSDVSGHWQRALEFINLVTPYFGDGGDHDLDSEARQRRVVERLTTEWQSAPPKHPIVVAGSTGSRGATGAFMQAVAQLPLGAVVLPGVDFDLPGPVWRSLDTAPGLEDHPQYRFVRLLADLGLSHTDIAAWVPDLLPPNPDRNRLISLALRPAPVTDQWLTEGQKLHEIGKATSDMTLLEAPSTRAEASAIALILRGAVQDGKTAALITPDRTLTRQVTAALDRWRIIPDDSAGRPLPLSAPGRFLRHIAALAGQKLTSEALLTLLKHPLTSSGADDRGLHLLYTRELELRLRRFGPPFPTAQSLAAWAAKSDESRKSWAAWLGGLIGGLEKIGTRSLSAHLDHHLALAQAFAAGPDGQGTGELWRQAAGREAQRQIEELRREAQHGGDLSVSDYASLFHAVLQRGEVREAVVAHPGIMIWGTLEARVQGADLVILGGLNEGVWPESSKPDPWLNRALRHRAGLLLPERQIGLSAHDYQQAVAAKEVVLTRSVRDAEAQTVPSRWINRLTNLMGGISDESAAALTAMTQRGARWLAMAEQLETPTQIVPPAPRPAPQPPVECRPREISITEVQTLIRDPYAVYAKRVLRLDPLDPLRQTPNPPLRGIIVHKILEQLIAGAPITDLGEGVARLEKIADAVLDAEAVWPAARRIWKARLMRLAEWFIAGEIERQLGFDPIGLERKAKLHLPDVGVLLKGKLDRVDRGAGGDLVIYDYKTGTTPNKELQAHFDKQLMLSAVIAERGEVDGIEPSSVSEVTYIGVGTVPKLESFTLQPGETAEVLAGLRSLLLAYQTRARGYVSRRAVDRQRFGGEYDHLARFGEWDTSQDADPQEVG